MKRGWHCCMATVQMMFVCIGAAMAMFLRDLFSEDTSRDPWAALLMMQMCYSPYFILMVIVNDLFPRPWLFPEWVLAEFKFSLQLSVDTERVRICLFLSPTPSSLWLKFGANRCHDQYMSLYHFYLYHWKVLVLEHLSQLANLRQCKPLWKANKQYFVIVHTNRKLLKLLCGN